jgi:hypothetical protein
MLLSKLKYCSVIALVLILGACSNKKGESVDVNSVINIHLNQVALELNGPKSAVVSATEPLDLRQVDYSLVANAEVVFQGKLTKLDKFSSWQSAHQASEAVSYYQADFSKFSKKGHFTLQINTQSQQVVSSQFVIAEQALFKETLDAMLQYFKGSRNDEDYNWQQDKHIRIYDTQRYVDVSGGWNDAGGDSGKYLSHLSYANFMNPQQLAHVAWALAYSYQSVPDLYDELALTNKVIDEVFWGADYLHRILDEQGYFYMTVFDQWHTNNAERVVTAYVGPDGIYTQDYQSAFRQGAGSAIAALARASMLSKKTGLQGQYSAKQYLASAEKAFHHLQDNNASNNKRYADDGIENIIDDYTALLAATELYKASNDSYYLQAARKRASNLAARLTDEGWFISNDINSDNLRPFYHAAEAGFPILALSQYLTIEQQIEKVEVSKQVIAKHLAYQLKLNNKVSNPFNYARQPYKRYQAGKLSLTLEEDFFIPHANETEYWWQGESARLSSLTMAAVIGGRAISSSDKNTLLNNFGISSELATFAQNQMDWTLGRNPYNLCMLNGFGTNNPIPYDGLSMVYGGISNGITAAKHNENADLSQGRGIEFGPEPDWQNWRWVEQWLPHSTWFLLATTEMAKTKY